MIVDDPRFTCPCNSNDRWRQATTPVQLSGNLASFITITRHNAMAVYFSNRFLAWSKFRHNMFASEMHRKHYNRLSSDGRKGIWDVLMMVRHSIYPWIYLMSMLFCEAWMISSMACVEYSWKVWKEVSTWCWCWAWLKPLSISMTNIVCWIGHELRMKDDYISTTALDSEVEGQRLDWAGKMCLAEQSGVS